MMEIAFQIKLKYMILKVCHVISGVIETKYLVQHEWCNCKHGLNKSASNSL